MVHGNTFPLFPSQHDHAFVKDYHLFFLWRSYSSFTSQKSGRPILDVELAGVNALFSPSPGQLLHQVLVQPFDVHCRRDMRGANGPAPLPPWWQRNLQDPGLSGRCRKQFPAQAIYRHALLVFITSSDSSTCLRDLKILRVPLLFARPPMGGVKSVSIQSARLLHAQALQQG